MEKIKDPERVRRMARVLFSDIVVYSGDQVRIGLEKDDIFVRLGSDIERARVFFEENVDAAVPHRRRIFNHALVDVLIAANRRISAPIW